MTLKSLSAKDEQTVNEWLEALKPVFKKDFERFITHLGKHASAFMSIPRGLSVDLDAGQVLALAREVVNQSGMSYPLAVREILAALDVLKRHFKSVPEPVGTSEIMHRWQESQLQAKETRSEKPAQTSEPSHA